MKPDLFLLYFAALLLSTVPARFQPSKPAIPHPFSLILFFQQLHEQPQPDSHFPVLTLYIPAIPPLSLFTVSLIYTAPIPSSVFQPRCSHSVIGFPASLPAFRHRFSSLAARIPLSPGGAAVSQPSGAFAKPVNESHNPAGKDPVQYHRSSDRKDFDADTEDLSF